MRGTLSGMLETSARLLRLLSLFQSRRTWSGPELAERLGVTTRTIRNDVDRLRSLGYPVDATPGVAGGYQLGAGAALPPLLLDDDEAVAVAVGLRTAVTAAAGVTGIEETSARALAKLEQVLPARLRSRVGALQAAVVAVTGPARAEAVDPEVLTVIAGACRDHDQLRFDYLSHDGSATYRVTEPHRLVHFGRRWYLLAWDVDRRDWRTFRVDRIEPRGTTGPRFEPREPPGDVAELVTTGVGTATWRLRATVTVHAPAAEVAERVPTALGVTVEPVDDRTCRLGVGADTPYVLALHLGLLGVDFEVHEPPQLIDELRRLAERCARAAR
jgi:predicted DNA-binding transcriptional regulator YafY